MYKNSIKNNPIPNRVFISNANISVIITIISFIILSAKLSILSVKFLISLYSSFNEYSPFGIFFILVFTTSE